MGTALLVMATASACGGCKSGSAATDAGSIPPDADRTDVGVEVGGSIPGCTLPPLGADFTHGWDLHVVTIAGTITLAGAPLPDSPGLPSRGSVTLRRRNSNDVQSFPVGATGAATFSGRLFAGTYDVSFQIAPGFGLIGLPGSAAPRLASAIVLASDQRLDYDLQLVPVSGVISLGGAALPDSPAITTRGSVSFRERQSGFGGAFPIGATGAGTFSGGLFPGTYDVFFQTVTDSLLLGLPQTATTPIATGVVVGRATGSPPPLAYDVRVATVSGTFTVNGAALADAPGSTSRGSLVFRDPLTGSGTSFPMSATGPGSYAGMIFAGRYDVSFQTRPNVVVPGLPPPPTARAALATDVLVQGASNVGLDFDLATVRVSGTITVQGAPLPDSTALRGTVGFVNRATGLHTTLSVSATGPASFTGTLLAGTYDVGYQFDFNGNLGVLPANGGSRRLATGLAITANATLAYDLPVVMVSGTITAGGGELPSSPGVATRGSVVFRDRESGGSSSLSLGATGPGAFAGNLFAGQYDVDFQTGSDPAVVGLPSPGRTRLASRLAIGGATAAQTALTWDLKVIAIGGTLTLDGAALPDSAGLTSRGSVFFRDKLTGGERELPLGASGAGTFAGSAFAGAFDVSLMTARDDKLIALPLAASIDLDVGCSQPTACTADPADLSGIWTLTFRDRSSWIDWTAILVQGGGALSGRFSSSAGYQGIFDSATRVGDTVELSSTQSTSSCALTLDATLSGGCLMVGTGTCARGVGGSILSQSPFIGVR
jgi:hypothetical protein